jgi:hypothetical protein
MAAKNRTSKKGNQRQERRRLSPERHEPFVQHEVHTHSEGAPAVDEIVEDLERASGEELSFDDDALEAEIDRGGLVRGAISGEQTEDWAAMERDWRLSPGTRSIGHLALDQIRHLPNMGGRADKLEALKADILARRNERYTRAAEERRLDFESLAATEERNMPGPDDFGYSE